MDSVDLNTEAEKAVQTFVEGLRKPGQDGNKKRRAGTKPPWQVDEHVTHFWSHVNKAGISLGPDPDSGANPFWHIAWRACAIAWQIDTYGAPVAAVLEEGHE